MLVRPSTLVRQSFIGVRPLSRVELMLWVRGVTIKALIPICNNPRKALATSALIPPKGLVKLQLRLLAIVNKA